MGCAALTIATRDFKSFWSTPLGWISACLMFLVSGIVFFVIVQVMLLKGSSLDPVAEISGQILLFVNYINIFVIPTFTMKTLSEEMNNGSFRLLAVSPLSVWSIVIGKFLGIFLYFFVISVLMLIYPLFSVFLGQPDFPVMISGWLGFLFNVASITAISLFVGALSKNSVLSYLGSVFFILFFLFFSLVPGLPEGYANNANLLFMSADLTKGIVKTGSLASYFAMICSFLCLAHFALENKKWRL